MPRQKQPPNTLRYSPSEDPQTRLPFIGLYDTHERDCWSVPRKGGYQGGNNTGHAMANAYIRYLSEGDQKDRFRNGELPLLQHIALDMFGIDRDRTEPTDSLLGQAVGFFSALEPLLLVAASLIPALANEGHELLPSEQDIIDSANAGLAGKSNHTGSANQEETNHHG